MELTDYNNFYLMISGDTRGATRLSLISNEFTAENLFRMHRVPEGVSIEFRKTSGTKYYDILGTDFAYLDLGSPKFWKLVDDHGLTGVKPIRIFVKGLDNFDHKLCSIIGKCGPKINDLSVQADKPFPRDPSKSFRTWIGLYFDLSTWDGSDFFSLEGTFYTIVTRKAKDILTKSKISNAIFTPISEVENYDLLLKSS